MAKKSMSKSVEKGHVCECGVCGTLKWILPLAILVVALVPGWYATIWAKWTIIIAAAAILLKRWCPCQHRH